MPSAIFAAFGDVTFSPKLSPTSFKIQQGAVFAEHSLVRQAPRLQFTGRELDTISLGMELHFSFCNPAKERDKLVNLMRAHEAHPLTFGDGTWWGWFVVERLSTTLEQCSPAGTPWLITLQAELKEFTGDPTKAMERPAVKSGSPALAVYPGRDSLLTLASPTAGGGVWDSMRQAVSLAGQAMGAANEAASIVSTVQEIFNSSGMGIAGKVLGSLDSLEGLTGRAAGLTGELTGSLTSCAAHLTGSFDGTLGFVQDAVGLAENAKGMLNDSRQIARQLTSIKNADSFGATMGALGNSLGTGLRFIERTSPVLQSFTARIIGRKELA